MKTKMKTITTILSLFALALLVVFPLVPKRVASAEVQEHLISPSKLAVLDNNLYVYDNYSKCLITRSKEPSSPMVQSNFDASLSLDDVLSLQTSSSKIFALTSDKNSNCKIVSLNKDLTQKTTFSFYPSSFHINEIIDFGVKEDTSGLYIYTLSKSGDIDILKQNELETGLVLQGTILKSNLSISSSDILLTQIETREDNILVMSQSSIYEIDPSTYEIEEIASNQDNIIALKSTPSTILGLKKSGIEIFSQNKKTITLDINATDMCVEENFIYLSSTDTHQIFRYNLSTDELVDLYFNSDIKITEFQANEEQIATLNEDCELFFKPYSVTPTLVATEGESLTILSNEVSLYPNFYYCLYSTGGKNYYLYLKKSTNLTLVSMSSQNLVITSIQRANLMRYPSNTIDSKNVVLEELPSGITLTACATRIENSMGDSFYKIVSKNKEGYVNASNFQNITNVSSTLVQCNAKLKRTSTLFVNSDGTNELITIKENTRIQVLEDYTSTKTYLACAYQDTDGTIYNGFILSQDIDPDGLSTLQILGLVLLSLNILLILIIVIIKQKSKKWKFTTPSDKETNLS